MLHTIPNNENADQAVLPPEDHGDVTDEEQDDANLEKTKVFSGIACHLEVFYDAVTKTEAIKRKIS